MMSRSRHLRLVEEILALPVPIDAPRHRDLAERCRQRAVAVVESERDLGHAERRRRIVAGEDDVVHAAAAQLACALCSPSIQRTASTKFDLPEPLGPTMAEMPGSKTRRVRSANVLKPKRSILLR